MLPLRCQNNTSGFDVGVEGVTGANAEPVANRSRKNDLTLAGNLGLHSKTILPLSSSCRNDPRTVVAGPLKLPRPSGKLCRPTRGLLMDGVHLEEKTRNWTHLGLRFMTTRIFMLPEWAVQSLRRAKPSIGGLGECPLPQDKGGRRGSLRWNGPRQTRPTISPTVTRMPRRQGLP